MLPQRASLRLVELVARFEDEKEVVLTFRHHSVGDGARDHDVVPFFVAKRSEVGLDSAAASMDEHELVSVRIAEIEGHRLRTARDADFDVFVA